MSAGDSGETSHSKTTVIIVSSVVVGVSMILLAFAVMWLIIYIRRRRKQISDNRVISLKKVNPLHDPRNTEHHDIIEKPAVHPTVIAFESALQRKIQELIKQHPEFETAKTQATEV